MPSITATQELHSSQLVTSTLCEHILSQDPEYGYEVIAKQLEAKTQVRQENHVRNTTEAEELRDLLSDPLRRAVDLAKEKGSSTWLTALPNMALPSTKGLFTTLSPSGMAGPHRRCPQCAPVEASSQWNMPYPVLRVGSHLSDTTRSAT